MPESNTLISKIATAFEQSAEPFALENARLAALPAEISQVKTPDPRYQLAQGVWLDYMAGAGAKTTVGPTETGDGVRLQLDDIGTSPWYSFSYAVSLEALRDVGYLGQFIKSSSNGPARFRVCLRLSLEDGHRDIFAREIVVLTGEEQEDLLFVRLDDKMVEMAREAEVLFFFEGNSFDVTLHCVEALRVR